MITLIGFDAFTHIVVRCFLTNTSNRYDIPVVYILSKVILIGYTLAILPSLASVTFAQKYDIIIEVADELNGQPVVSVMGTFHREVAAADRRGIRFLRSYAGNVDLADRIREIEFFSGDRSVAFINLGNGDLVAAEPIDRWRFKLRAVVPVSSRTAGHVSWFENGRGIVFLDDLIPQFANGSDAVVRFRLPQDWQITTAERNTGDVAYSVADTSRASFYLSRTSRSVTTIGNSTPQIAVDGEFRTADRMIGKFAGDISDQLEKVFATPPPRRSVLAIARFPTENPYGTWEADARGSTIVILSADMPFATQSQQLIHEQLRHELFHQWIPNGIELKGDYAWFYEGFALYQSLKIAVGSGRIRFIDKLETLSNAERIASFADRGAIRDTRNPTEMYARGMLAAFYLDILLMDSSGGKRSVETYLRSFYAAARRQPDADANELIVRSMIDERVLRSLIDGVIFGRNAFDHATVYARAGLILKRVGGTIRIEIVDKPNRSQRAMLRRLGYNG